MSQLTLKIQFQLQSHPPIIDMGDAITPKSSFASTLLCPACLNFFTVPVYLCPRGHSVCAVCRQLSLQCPLCCSRYEEDVQTRNAVLEAVLGKLVVNCENDGCPATVPLSSLHLHHSRCPFSRYLACLVCPSYEEDLVSHLITVHSYREIHMESGFGQRIFAGPHGQWLCDSEWPPAIWRLEGEAVVAHAQTRNGVFHIYLYRVGRANIRVSVRVKCKEKVIKFVGTLKHTSEGEGGAHFHCEVSTLERFFVRVLDSNGESVKLRVRVKRKKIGKSGL